MPQRATSDLIQGNQNLTRLGTITRTDDSAHLQDVHHAGSAAISQTQAALEEALSSAAGMPGQDEAFRRLKAERDALRRAIKTGEIWEDSTGS